MENISNLAIIQLFRDLTSISRDNCKSEEVTPMEMMTLLTIYDNERTNNSGICAKDLANLINMKKSALTRVIAVLELKGYMERTIPLCNKRTIMLKLSNKGRELIESNIKEFDLVISNIRKAYGEEEFYDLFIKLVRLKDVIKEVSEVK